jgi:hypothetical protein
MATDTVYALFESESDTERAIGALIDHGINRDDIGVIARKPGSRHEEPAEYVRIPDQESSDMGDPVASYIAVPGMSMPPTGIPTTYAPIRTTATVQTHSGAPEDIEAVGKAGLTTTTTDDAIAGAAVGGGIGLVAGVLASAIALTVPGIGIILAGGALAAALGATAATAAAGAVAGGVAGYLQDMGMTEQAASGIASRIGEGDYLLSVRVDTTRLAEVEQLLIKYNAVRLDDRPVDSDGYPAPRIITEQSDGTPIVPAVDITSDLAGQYYLDGGEVDVDDEVDETLDQHATGMYGSRTR